ncbi:Deleted in malignant brain tumors 1 protein [Holothuria leucospilota]|uniref:Deleted in malignant brain tumors 1 protein n=1 Tax=Holothuria leucospilota TaxID=206669 RepID=A0A9Q1BIE8_HOLLE|nr:Deleted in malignant brain tumors 1 protein [Holothuria leucospilota]
MESGYFKSEGFSCILRNFKHFLVITGGYFQGVRLVDGFSNFSGRVEVFRNGEWGTVCDPLWFQRDAKVVCRHLGFKNAIAALKREFFGQGSGPIWIVDVFCEGHETSLLQCNYKHGGSDCDHIYVAGVVCTGSCLFYKVSYTSTGGKVLKFTSAGTGNKIDKVRLVDGSSNSSGRIEVLFDGEWGTVCQEEWTLADANVVCKQLGYQSVIVSFRNALFGEGSGIIWMTNVHCTGNEMSLSGCNYTLFGNLGCSHHQDVGVLCGEMYLQETRLVDGHSNDSGRLEVLINDEWGTVCDEEWDMKDATVACRQLGFPAAIFTYSLAHFGEGFGRIWMSDVQCKGTELSLLECKHERYQKPSCNHTGDVGVLCGGKEHNHLKKSFTTCHEIYKYQLCIKSNRYLTVTLLCIF